MFVTVSFTPAAIFPAAGKNERQVFAMRGWLQKQSPSKLKGLQRRFFVLDEARDLSYYKSDTDMAKGVAPKGVIPLSQLRSVRRTPGALSFDLDVGYRTFTLVARTEAELASWLRAIDPGVAAGGVGGAKPPGPGPGPSSPSEQPSESANPFGAASPESSLEAGASAPLDDAPPGAPTPAVPGVLLAAWLLKSPPNLSLRRNEPGGRADSTDAPPLGTRGVEADLCALGGLCRLCAAEVDELPVAWCALRGANADAPIAVVEAILARRPELAKRRRAPPPAMHRPHTTAATTETCAPQTRAGRGVQRRDGTERRCRGGAGGGRGGGRCDAVSARSCVRAKQQLGGGRAKEVALGRRLRAALSGCERDEAHLDGAWARPDALTGATLPRAVSRRASYVDTTPVLYVQVRSTSPPKTLLSVTKCTSRRAGPGRGRSATAATCTA